MGIEFIVLGIFVVVCIFLIALVLRCKLGLHSGYIEDGAFHCVSCGYVDYYNKRDYVNR